jgi:rod shape-determining protein MreD
MGNWLGFPLLILAAVLQVTFVPQIRILGGEPDLVFLLVLAYAIRSPLDQGLIWAMIGGIMRDLTSSTPTGTHALALLLVVFALDRLKGQVIGIGFLSIIAITIIGTVIVEMTAIVITVLSGYAIRPISLITYNVLPSIAYNLFFVFPIYGLVRRFVKVPATSTM